MVRGFSAEPGERILTIHPQGKKGVSISRQKYDVMSAATLRSLRGRGGVPLQVVLQKVDGDLQGKFEGATSWYFTTVKLDLEARGILVRVPGKTPQQIMLREGPSDRGKG